MTRSLVIAYAASIVALCGTAAYRWTRQVPRGRNDDFIIPIASSSTPAGDRGDSAMTELEEMIAANDPFRLSNTPSAVAYDPDTDGPTGSNVALQRIRPSFALKAIVGGPPWQAIVDGIPGETSGTVVAGGMTFGKLLIRSVARDSVVIQGPDTTWVLAFRDRS